MKLTFFSWAVLFFPEGSGRYWWFHRSTGLELDLLAPKNTSQLALSASGGPYEVEQSIYHNYPGAQTFTIATSMQSAPCTGITVVNHCIYQHFQCKFQGVCLHEDLLKSSERVRRCSLVLTSLAQAQLIDGTTNTDQNLLEKKVQPGKKNVTFIAKSSPQ